MQVSGFCFLFSHPLPFEVPQGRSSTLSSQRATLWLARFLEMEKSGQEPAPDGASRIHVVVPVHATRKTLREALWFEVNPRPCPVKCEAYLTGVKDSAQETLRLCALCERLKALLGSVADFFCETDIRMCARKSTKRIRLM